MIDLTSSMRFHSSRCMAIIASNVQVSGLVSQMPGSAYVISMRQRHSEKRIAIALFLLWTLHGNMTIRADENQSDTKSADENWRQVELVNEQRQDSSLLEGKRLFFNHKQRQALKSNADIDSGSLPSDLLSKEEAAGSVANVEQQPSIVVTEPVGRIGTIYYHARIEGPEVIRVIVNGLPCEAVNRTDIAGDSSGTALDCKSIIAKRLQLLLLADGASIQIMDSGRVKGIITPGSSL